MNKLLFFGIILLLRGFTQVSGQIPEGQPFFVGTYTDGKSEGIYKFILHDGGSLQKVKLLAKASNPSFLTLSGNKRFLLAVNEDKQGAVESFSVADDTLLLTGKSSSGGSSPCYVFINSSGYVLVSNYGSGTVGLLKMNHDGNLSKLLFVEDHNAKNYPVANAHAAQFVPGSNMVISADLGTNRLWFSRLDSSVRKLVPLKRQTLNLPDKSRPRHFVLHPNGKWIYVVNETGNSVSLIKRVGIEDYALVEMVSTLPDGYNETSYGGDIHLSADNRFLYASNRGFNSIAIFNVNPKNGSITLIGNEPVHGDFPRNFALSPDNNYLLVANQKSDNIVAFKRNKDTGMLQYVDEVAAPKPVCILFYGN